MFIAIDGDSVGKQIEHLILNEKLDELLTFSRRIDSMISQIAKKISDYEGEIYLSGGDNILAKIINTNDLFIFLKKINHENGDIQFSVGIGEKISLAYLALKFSKTNQSSKICRATIYNHNIVYSLL